MCYTEPMKFEGTPVPENPQEVTPVVNQEGAAAEKEGLTEAEKSQLIAAAKSPEALYAALEQVGNLKGSNEKVYDTSELRKAVEDALMVPVPIAMKAVTRSGGLRDKVAELVMAGWASHE
jgi:hypothetical protein